MMDNSVVALTSGFSSDLTSTLCSMPIFPEGLPSVSASSSSSAVTGCCFTSILGSSGAGASEEASWELWSTLLTEAGVEACPSAVKEDFWESWKGEVTKERERGGEVTKSLRRRGKKTRTKARCFQNEAKTR